MNRSRSPHADIPPLARTSPARFTALALILAAVVFAAVAPTLAWLEFSSGSENLVVGTVANSLNHSSDLFQNSACIFPRPW
jgi:hypothetical protein